MMTTFKLELVLLLSCVLLACGCTQPLPSNSSSTQTSKKIALISMTSDPGEDLQATNMGLTFAGFCVDEGYDVNIFLNVKGVKLATKVFSENVKYLDHKPFKEQLKALNERGVQVHVCPVCMKDLQITDDQIIPAAFVTDKPKLFGKLGPSTIVFTY